MNNPVEQSHLLQTRRHFFGRSSTGIGVAALASLMNESAQAGPQAAVPAELAKIAPKAKRVIYMLQSGAPSQVDLFDHKPSLEKLDRTELPESIRHGQ